MPEDENGYAQREHRFRQLYEEHYRAVQAYAVRRVDAGADVADTVAEVFTTAWRRLADIPPSPADRLWLYGVARRVLAGQHRSSRRFRRLIDRIQLSHGPGPQTAELLPDSPNEPLIFVSCPAGGRRLPAGLMCLRVWSGSAGEASAAVCRLPRGRRRARNTVSRVWWVPPGRGVWTGLEASPGSAEAAPNRPNWRSLSSVMFRPASKPATAGPERVRWRHSGHTPRRNAGLAAYENVLARAGFSPVAGIDEAGRGACAGPLVVAAVVLDNQAIRPIRGLADSKALTPEEREDVYARVMRRALDWHVVAIPPQEVDRIGLHVCNVEGMRRALAGLRHRPAYVLTDGFPVRGLGTPALAVWKGDQVTASVAAASVVAKVTRDRMMVELDESYPAYGFARHKGYSTPEHMSALCAWGPCPEHRYSYVNVIQANRRWATGWQDETGLDGEALVDEDAVDEDAVVDEGAAVEEGAVADGPE